MSTPLSTLVNIISSGVQTLESAYSKDGSAFPSLEDPFRPTPLDHDATLTETKLLIVAAAAQIIANVHSPIATLQEHASGMYLTAALGFIVDANVAVILTDAGAQGLHVKEISAQNGIDPSYLGMSASSILTFQTTKTILDVTARILRFLATRHIFKEATPNVFANNLISSLLITVKSLDEIKADPDGKFDGAPMASFIAASADEALKSSAFISSFLQNPGTAAAPFNIALKTKAKVWEYYEEPGNEGRARRFTAAMSGGDAFPPSIFTDAINGFALNPNDVVVDVGGNIGSVTLIFAKAFPHLRYVVQDLDKQIIEARKFWQENAPEIINSGRVQLQVCDFFTPQPIKGAAIYFLRVVIHDWPDSDAKKILSNLRTAANSSSKLILFDFLVGYACQAPETSGAVATKGPPFPLLSNLGIAGAGFSTSLDIQMLNMFNGKERTEDEFRELGDATGWKLESTKPGPLAAFVFSAA